MRGTFGKYAARIAAAALVWSFAGATSVRAGITLVITVSDSHGTATETITSPTNTPTFSNGVIQNSATVGSDPNSVFGDFVISVGINSNNPGTVNSKSAFVTTAVNEVDFVGRAGDTATNDPNGNVKIAVLSDPFMYPGAKGTVETIDSSISTSNASSGAFQYVGFATTVTQSQSAFEPNGSLSSGAQTLYPSPVTNNESSEVKALFTRSDTNFRLSNYSNYGLTLDPDGDGPVATTATSTVTVSTARDLATLPQAIATPEPATFAMILTGLPVASIAIWRRRRRDRGAAVVG